MGAGCVPPRPKTPEQLSADKPPAADAAMYAQGMWRKSGDAQSPDEFVSDNIAAIGLTVKASL